MSCGFDRLVLTALTVNYCELLIYHFQGGSETQCFRDLFLKNFHPFDYRVELCHMTVARKILAVLPVKAERADA